MKKKEQKGFRISALTLGTVQLGLHYSLNGEKPNMRQSHEMLKCATEQGISVLDTAREYGDSEEVIGSFLSTSPHPMVVVTKFKIDPGLFADPERAFAASCRSVRESLRRLGLKKIPILLFHKGPQHPLEDTQRVIPHILTKLKELDLIDIGGISVFEPAEIEAFQDNCAVEAFQAPVNVFDHRLLQSRALQNIYSSGKIVFARSIFLKGLFFQDPERLEGVLEEAVPYLKILRQMAQRHQISIAQLAFSFVQGIPEISSMVFGADNSRQVLQNIQLLRGPELSADLREEIYRTFSNVPTTVITPHLWAI
jgi:aryl-alcohol dehydrogenase-like predicted oxidoreductase